MDPVTHALASVCLGRAGLNRAARVATPILLVSGVIADVDWFTRFAGPAAFFRGYRTIAHSLIGTVAITFIVAAVFWIAGRAFPKFAVGFFPSLALCTAGAGSHLLLDLLNDYGVKLLWPFRAKWYAWDLMSRVDPWILFFLLLGVVVPDLFGLVQEEIGSKRRGSGRRYGAVLALILVALFIGARAIAHQRAIALLNSRNYRGEASLTVGAFPNPSNPLLWSGVVETDNALITLEVPLWPSQFDPESADVHFKPDASAALQNATRAATAKEFLSFARFPLASVEAVPDGFEVRFRDLRFAAETGRGRALTAVINLNTQDVVTGEQFEFDSEAHH